MHLNRVNPLTNIGQRSPSSAKATVAQIEMSSTLLTRTSRGKGPATADDAEDAASPAPTPARNKSGRFVRQQPTEEIDESGTAVPTIPSGSRVIDEDTPVDSTVEDANDQLGGEGIRNPSNRPAFQGNHELSENLEAARREIAALRAANQELRHSIAPRKKRKTQSHGTGTGDIPIHGIAGITLVVQLTHMRVPKTEIDTPATVIAKADVSPIGRPTTPQLPVNLIGTIPGLTGSPAPLAAPTSWGTQTHLTLVIIPPTSNGGTLSMAKCMETETGGRLSLNACSTCLA